LDLEGEIPKLACYQEGVSVLYVGYTVQDSVPVIVTYFLEVFLDMLTLNLNQFL